MASGASLTVLQTFSHADKLDSGALTLNEYLSEKEIWALLK
jgi:hypothetical protein